MEFVLPTDGQLHDDANVDPLSPPVVEPSHCKRATVQHRNSFECLLSTHDTVTEEATNGPTETPI